MTITDRDARALIAIVAKVHGEMLVDQLPQGFPEFLQRRLRDVMLIEADTNGGEVSTALGGEVSMALDKIVERLRAAIGEYD